MAEPENDPAKEKKSGEYKLPSYDKDGNKEIFIPYRDQNPVNDPKLERGHFEDLGKEHGNSLRRLVGFTSDVVESVRGTIDYQVALAAIEHNEFRYSYEDPFQKAKDEANDNAIDEEVLAETYKPKKRRDVEVGIRTLNQAARIASPITSVRDKYLQRRMAYQLALDDFENRRTRGLLKAYADRHDFGSITESKKTGDQFAEHSAGIFSFPISGTIPEFQKEIKPDFIDPLAEYDPTGGKGKKPE